MLPRTERQLYSALAARASLAKPIRTYAQTHHRVKFNSFFSSYNELFYKLGRWWAQRLLFVISYHNKASKKHSFAKQHVCATGNRAQHATGGSAAEKHQHHTVGMQSGEIRQAF